MAVTKKTFIDPPVLKRWIAILLFIADLFIPGLGTIIAGCLACSLETLIVGIIQMLTSWLIVGWVWSILWGWELVAVSRSGKIDIPGADHNRHGGPDALL
eukprot:jgi/Undpi1/10546/HiC_scaffold_29.g12996.m1